jgi:hypothetical protein
MPYSSSFQCSRGSPLVRQLATLVSWRLLLLPRCSLCIASRYGRLRTYAGEVRPPTPRFVCPPRASRTIGRAPELDGRLIPPRCTTPSDRNHDHSTRPHLRSSIAFRAPRAADNSFIRSGWRDWLAPRCRARRSTGHSCDRVRGARVWPPDRLRGTAPTSHQLVPLVRTKADGVGRLLSFRRHILWTPNRPAARRLRKRPAVRLDQARWKWSAKVSAVALAHWRTNNGRLRRQPRWVRPTGDVPAATRSRSFCPSWCSQLGPGVVRTFARNAPVRLRPSLEGQARPEALGATKS